MRQRTIIVAVVVVLIIAAITPMAINHFKLHKEQSRRDSKWSRMGDVNIQATRTATKNIYRRITALDKLHLTKTEKVKRENEIFAQEFSARNRTIKESENLPN